MIFVVMLVDWGLLNIERGRQLRASNEVEQAVRSIDLYDRL